MAVQKDAHIMVSRNYKRYILFVLLTAYTLNFIDRQILALLLEPIKQDLNLNDTQLGFLSGIAFALFYCTLGIPIARWADIGNRVTIISIAITVWSAMTALCGLATNFIQLLLARVGVGVGEAGCTPPAHSLIADYFDRGERPQALATYMMGTSLGVLLGFSIAGWINEIYGWRVAFFVLGLPGLLLAAIVKLTIKEPRIEMLYQTSSVATPSLKATATRLWCKRPLRHLTVALTLVNFIAFGLTTWFPAYFIRTHGMQTGELGMWLALVGGGGGLLGTFIGGYWATRYAANNEKLQMRLLAIVQLVLIGIMSTIILLPWPRLALSLLGVYVILNSLSYGPTWGLVQALVEERMRAMAVAMIFFAVNLIGMGLGPQVIGIFSDLMAPNLGSESLRWAILMSLPAFVWAAYHFWRVGEIAPDELAAVEVENNASESVKSKTPNAPRAT